MWRSEICWFGVHRIGPWVPRYVTTGCFATFGATSASVVLDATRKAVRRDVKETILSDINN